jgi:hypothetical protein
MQRRGSAAKERDNVIAQLHVTCPGLGNNCFIYSARQEPWISSNILTLLSFILLYDI